MLGILRWAISVLLKTVIHFCNKFYTGDPNFEDDVLDVKLFVGWCDLDVFP